MRCRRHYYDVSSYIGVCASCLHERLSALMEAEAQMSFQTLPDKQQSNPSPPPQLLFPGSVSQYTIKRHLEAEDSLVKHHQWIGLFSTPQFEITSTTKTTKTIHTAAAANKFTIIRKLFRSKSAKFKADEELQRYAPHPNSNSVSSLSWFTSLRRKLKFSQSTPDRTLHTNRCIETSPNRKSCDTPGGQMKKKSTSSASSRRVKSAANFKGLIFGLSPLVQPSPIRLRSHHSYSSESFSCEPRVPAKATMSTSSSLRGSRSTKLAESLSLIYMN